MTNVAFSPEPRFRWPGNAKCAVVLCFDVDGETTALEHDESLRNRLTTWSQCAYGPTVGVPRILAVSYTHLTLPTIYSV